MLIQLMLRSGGFRIDSRGSRVGMLFMFQAVVVSIVFTTWAASLPDLYSRPRWQTVMYQAAYIAQVVTCGLLHSWILKHRNRMIRLCDVNFMDQLIFCLTISAQLYTSITEAVREFDQRQSYLEFHREDHVFRLSISLYLRDDV